jgi:acetyl-CoA carboxylase carboxyl transferase subunit beta
MSKTPLPLDAHTAEAHLSHGLIDNVVDRESLRPRLATLLQILTHQRDSKSHKELLKSELTNSPEPANPWEAVTIAHHAERPSAMFYMRALLDPFFELRGDRLNSDDRSIVGGLGYLSGEPVAMIGQQRRASPEGERYHVFPDGLRKAQRIITLASRFKLPLITLVDTQGADPGLEAEEQGIGNAIATTLSMMADAPTPIISVIIGEGGSEGALALGISDRIIMQQFAVYSPISLNRNLGGPYPNHLLDREAAEALMLNAHDCVELGIVDAIVPEPEGGSHANPREAANTLHLVILRHLAEIAKLSESKLLKRRYQKFRQMGENTAYSQEAMDREVALLMKISVGIHGRGRGRKRASETAVAEAQIAPVEVD